MSTPGRPCPCDRAAAGRPYTLDQCRRCWKWKNDPAYRRGMRVRAGAADPEPRPKAARTPLPVRPPCGHLGSVLDRLDEAGRPCLCAGKWLHGCDVHGACTRVARRKKVACCVGCNDYLHPEDDRP